MRQQLLFLAVEPLGRFLNDGQYSLGIDRLAQLLGLPMILLVFSSASKFTCAARFQAIQSTTNARLPAT